MTKEKLTISKGGKESLSQAVQKAIVDAGPIVRDAVQKTGEQIRLAGIALQRSQEPFARERITQSRGLTYTGEMRLIADYTTDPDGTKPAWQELEIWETRSGKWIAVIMGKYQNPNDARKFTKATLFEDVRPDDLDFQIAVADALDWTSAARVMLREQFGWKLAVEVA